MIERLLFILALAASISCTLFYPTTNQASVGVSPKINAYVTKTPFRLLVIEKSSQNLMLYEQGSTLELVQSFTCATGENPGNKLESGDSRTPEGVYFITEIYEDKKITVFGSRAFHLDYPNIFDTHSGRSGNGIFIHGTNKELIPFSSNGCITLDNKDLDQLAPYLTINRIPIIIVDTLSRPIDIHSPAIQPGSKIFTEMLDSLKFNAAEVPVQDIDSLYFIEVGNQAVAMISYAVYDGDNLKFSYHKRAYFSRNQSQSWRSIYAVEGQDAIPSLLARKVAKTGAPALTAVPEKAVTTPQPAIVESTEKVDTSEEDLLAFIENWRQSWSTKDLDAYMACYSPTFSSNSLDIRKWRAKKRSLNRRYAFINVTIKDIVVNKTSTGASVSFYQTYESDKYQTSGTKHLELVLIDNQWKIQKEYM